MGQTARQVLQDVFGYTAFRPGQEEIIEALSAGEPLLAVMPTGAGKSLCYQIPAIRSERLAIVVSPLVALMDDQVAGLRANGVAAASLHSGLAGAEQSDAWHGVRSGTVRLLYLSPERLMTDRMLEALQALKPAYFIIDEAHCISKWGASFRPEYEQLSGLVELFPEATICGFTATADEATRQDIAQKLFRGRGRIIVQGFDRPNLRLGAASREAWKDQLLTFLARHQGESGIIYCLSRAKTEEVASFLDSRGLTAIAYHAGQPAETRRHTQNRFMTEPAVIMAATIAFGMGIDKPDIRFVCHLNLPSSMEAYYQEIGRAGRDGAPAETLLLYGLDDIQMRRRFIEEDGEDPSHKMREHKRLDALIAYCETAHCRRAALLAYFDEQIEPCGNCDICLDPPDLVDGTRPAQMLLSAVIRTGQMFGVAHIIDVLRGSQNAKITQRGHDRLPTYGVGKEHSKRFWQAFARQAVSAGLLRANIERFGGLELTAEGMAVLKGQAEYRYRAIKERSTSKAAARTGGALRPAPPPAGSPDAELVAALKRLRLDLARARNLPAYIVFPDATLIDMAAQRPATLEAMARIGGVGPKKLAEFGAAFLEVIAAAKGASVT